MKAYSVDLRSKIVAAHLEQNLSIRKTAEIFAGSKSSFQKVVKQQKIEGNLQPKPRGKPRFSPDFNPIELWWSQLKSLLRKFSPTTTKIVDTIIAVALDLINPKHLKNWFTNCCYCTS